MEVGSLSVPVRADLGPITADLARLRQQLAAIGGGAGGRGGQSPFGQLEREVTRARGSVGGLTSSLAPLATALAGVLGVQQLIQFADTWSDISGRVGQAIGDLDRVPQVMARIAQTARQTYSSLNLTAEGFVRNSTVLKELGLSTQQQLDYQEALNNALVVSGARGRAAEFVQESLNRALALGRVRGIELNNVLNYGGRVAELLAERFNTTTGGLMKLAAEGKITGEVIQDVLISNLEKLREEADALDATIGDGFILLGNALLQTVGQFDQLSGTSLALANALIFVADNMQRLLTYVATATVGWGAYRVAIIAVNAGLFTTAGALAAVQVAFRRLLISSGIGILVVAVGELVNIIWEARSASESWSDAWQRVGTFFTSVTYAMRTAFSGFVLAADGLWKRFVADFLATAAQAAGVFGTFLDVADQIAVLEGASRQSLAGASIRFGDAASALSDAYKKLREGVADTDLSGDGGPNRSVPEIDEKASRAAERLREAYANILRDGRAFIEMQGIEQQAIGMTDLEAAKLRATFDLLNQAQRAGIELTAAQTEELTNLAHQMAEAEYATDKLRERYEFAQDTFKGFFTDLKTELQNGASIWEAFGNAAANALQKIADKALDLALSGIFDMLFGAFGGGTTSFLGGILSGSRVGLFANGTSYAPGGMAVVGERGPELVRLPGGAQVTPNNRVTAPMHASFGGSGTGNDTQRVIVDVFVKDDGKLGAIARQEAAGVVEVAIHEYDAHTLPSSMERVSNHPRIR